MKMLILHNVDTIYLFGGIVQVYAFYKMFMTTLFSKVKGLDIGKMQEMDP